MRSTSCTFYVTYVDPCTARSTHSEVAGTCLHVGKLLRLAGGGADGGVVIGTGVCFSASLSSFNYPLSPLLLISDELGARKRRPRRLWPEAPDELLYSLFFSSIIKLMQWPIS